MNIMSVSPFFKQLLVAGPPQLAALSVGGVVGYPGVLLHQLRSNDSSIQLNLDTASWIGSLHGLAGIPSIIMPIIMQWRGRKFAFIAACTLLIIGWILAYAATNITHILISESFHGLGTNSILTVSFSTLGEMVTPRYRNVSLISYSIVQALGMALVGIAARYLHWKTISLAMCGPVLLAFILACLWPESPSWLACKGKFDKCEEAFKWLRGSDDASNSELEELIKAQKEVLSATSKKTSILANFSRTISCKDFYIPCLHMFVLLNLMYWSGVMVILIYSIELIEKVTLNKNAAFTGGILMNTVLFVGFTITGGLVRRFNNKPVLLVSSIATSFCLLGACIVTYLQSIGMLSKDSLLCLYCLLAYIVCASLGLSSIVFAMAAELMPVKHRGLGGALYVIYTCVLHTSSLKLSPYLFLYLNMWGTFLIYTVNAILCTLFVWKFVPETKARTLQEIEDFYMFGKFGSNRDDSETEAIRINKR